jgi:hypothetical protein
MNHSSSKKRMGEIFQNVLPLLPFKGSGVQIDARFFLATALHGRRNA